MGKYQILLRSALKKQKGSMGGIFLLTLLTAVCLFSSVTLMASGGRSISEEMDRLGFGSFTVWTNGEEEALARAVEALPDTEKVTVQPLIFSGYQIGGQYSDNEGQLIAYDGSVPYRFTDARGNVTETPTIRPGEIYISPAMRSGFDVETGETIRFELSRQSGMKDFTVAGYFADGFMGSSMIDMKSFLICGADWDDALAVLDSAADYDVLGWRGAMLHVFQSADSALDEAAFHKLVQESTDLSLYTEFTYQKASIKSYMLLLQNILSGFLLAFSAVLLAVCMVVTGHNLSAVLEQDGKNLAVLKTIGFTGKTLRRVYLAVWGTAILMGLLAGLALALPLSHAVADGMVTSTGMKITVTAPIGLLAGILAVLLASFGAFLFLRTAGILRVRPMQTLGAQDTARAAASPLRKKALPLWLAVRALLANKRKYTGLFLISLLLTLFLSVIGVMGAWLGPNGEGLMNAFSVAEHDLGVQPFNETVPMDEIERVINWYSPIREKYELAMESVTVNGTEYTANVLNDTGYFHVLSGTLCGGDEVLITDTVAREQGLSVGDRVRIAANGRAEEYTVSGIYMCANGMGSNIGLSLEGYSKIGNITGYIWCYHYILEDGSIREYAMQYLQDNYSGIDVHTNAWSGLAGIVLLMHLLIAVIYLISALFILVAAAMICAKLFGAEISDIAICKSLGVRSRTLRLSFALRFLLISAGGAALGTLVSKALSGRLVGALFKMFGIGAFSASHSLAGTLLPPLVVTLLFFVFALLLSRQLKHVNMNQLISENEK